MRIVVLGAGSIGCYVGGRLAAGGSDVVLIGRQSLRDACDEYGLTITDLAGFQHVIAPTDVNIAISPDGLNDADIVLLTVKGKDTPAAAAEIKAHAPAQALIISLQNGVRNADILRDQLTQHVVTGMVPFNVVRQAASHFHCGTEGHLVFEKVNGELSALLAELQRAGIAAELHENIVGVQWGKLLMNLNNPIVALTGLPLVDELRNRVCRRILALSIREGTRVLRKAGIRPARIGKVPTGLLPLLLRLPNFIFLPLASSMLKVDPQARSSMWEDLNRRRTTEIDYLNGEILLLAKEQHSAAPVNQAITELIKHAERENIGSPELTPNQLLEAVGRGWEASRLLAAMPLLQAIKPDF